MLHIQSESGNDDLVIRLSQEEAAKRGLHAGDEVEVMKLPDPMTIQQTIAWIGQEYAGTFAFLKDK